jgi:TPP-dependent pyruvate/acetoin dehydrogenase alpha subunit
MLRVRLFEERVRELYAGGRLPGFIHLSTGQEAVAAGAAAALRADDYVFSTHRGHGHLIAKGGSLRGLLAELYGKQSGVCRGKGGSMHIADVSVGYLGANGVLAAGCVLAPGVGLAIKHRKSGQVALTFFGDVAANRGPFHEGVNLAALWRLPVVFVCENNRWASSTAHGLSTAGGRIAGRAAPGSGSGRRFQWPVHATRSGGIESGCRPPSGAWARGKDRQDRGRCATPGPELGG